VALDVVMLQCGLSSLTLRCLDSIYETAPWARVILVDNGSPRDDLLAALHHLRDQDELIANPENMGFAPAVNQGIKTSSAEYVAIQNNDTVMFPHGYERMIQHLENDSSLGCVGPMTNNADSQQRGEATENGGVVYTDGLVAFFCTILPRRVIDHVGLLSEDYGLGYGEDDDYCIRLRHHGFNLGIARDVYVQHDHHVTYRHLIGDEGIDRLGREGLAVLHEKHG
jgi:GT2 family glycosyltransferase